MKKDKNINNKNEVSMPSLLRRHCIPVGLCQWSRCFLQFLALRLLLCLFLVSLWVQCYWSFHSGCSLGLAPGEWWLAQILSQKQQLEGVRLSPSQSRKSRVWGCSRIGETLAYSSGSSEAKLLQAASMHVYGRGANSMWNYLSLLRYSGM
jgi:hypothetical protein